jgi:hypothetical protein
LVGVFKGGGEGWYRGRAEIDQRGGCALRDILVGISEGRGVGWCRGPADLAQRGGQNWSAKVRAPRCVRKVAFASSSRRGWKFA